MESGWGGMDQVAQPDPGVDIAADWSAGAELGASIKTPAMVILAAAVG